MVDIRLTYLMTVSHNIIIMTYGISPSSIPNLLEIFSAYPNLT